MDTDKLFVEDLQVRGKKVLVRVDFNVPLEQEDGAYRITDDRRIVESLQTIRWLMRQGAKTILMSHLGRPKGGKPEPKYSLAPVAARLQELLGQTIPLAKDCVGEPASSVVSKMKDGDVVLLENLRFHAEEEKNDPGFAKQLAELGDAYVDDAFSAAHRAHASIEALAHLLPAAAGKNMRQELEALGAALEHPQRPVIALVGGAKVSTKLDLLKFMTGKVDKLAIGGAMANTFLHAQGKPVGRSLCEKELADTARAILAEAEKRGCEIILPEDAVTAEKLEQGAVTRTVGVNAVPMNAMILDVGPDTVARIGAALEGSKTQIGRAHV